LTFAGASVAAKSATTLEPDDAAGVSACAVWDAAVSVAGVATTGAGCDVLTTLLWWEPVQSAPADAGIAAIEMAASTEKATVVFIYPILSDCGGNPPQSAEEATPDRIDGSTG
jgi:hypothetical protein